MNKYSQLLKKLGLSAAALALSATLAVDSASAADENATDETVVEQNVEADTATEEKTPEATQSEQTQPEQTDRIYGRTPVPHVNYDHAYFTHKTSKTENLEWPIISFYINGNLQSENRYKVSSDAAGYGYITYDALRDTVEEKIKEYHAKGFILDKLDDNPYDRDHSYYFVDDESLLTNKEEAPAAKPEEQKPEAGKKEEQKPEAGKKEEQKLARKKSKNQKLARKKNRNQKQARKILLAKLKLTNMTASGELLEQKKKRHNLLQESSSTMDLNN
ncbi:hypothetical protein [Dolosigranulum pigrum]|uniref:hypothetical protein n=1 Tax=Dolosigranulum pigrum TaxID=29394 RepID=UPI00243164D7|nr:hypothetical protein [Dolosigranulum pigrum]